MSDLIAIAHADEAACERARDRVVDGIRGSRWVTRRG